MERAVIFLTGGGILALQLLASRIMTPFFGVSLHIWTGILSITLLCLAGGYHLGGRFTKGAPPRRLAFTFYLLPAMAGLAVGLAGLAYPVALGPLARFHLLGGSFLACLLLLALPLTALSALNPLLIALERPPEGEEHDDAGAGRVFFISTMGSVAGVLVTALLFIPYWSNLATFTAIGGAMALLALWGGMRHPALPRRARWLIGLLALAGMAGCQGAWLLHGQGADGRTFSDGFGNRWQLIATHPSPFGVIKVAELNPGPTRSRELINNGMSQNSILADGHSRFLFSHVMDALARRLQPRAHRALVLGLGAGILPTALAQRGARVEVVELNPAMVEVARRHFGFQPGPALQVRVADARTVVQGCRDTHDLILVDLFLGDGLPEHLASREFMEDLRRCLTHRGVVVMDTFFDPHHPGAFAPLVETMAAVFGAVGVVQERDPGEREPLNVGYNAYLAAGRHPAAITRLARLVSDGTGVPEWVRPHLAASLATWRVVTPRVPLTAKGGEVLTDLHNRLTLLAMPAQEAYRARILERIPDQLLLD